MPPVSSRRHRFRVARRCRLRRVSCPLDQTRYRYCCRSHIIPAIAAALAIVCFIIMFVSACCALAGATVRYPGVEFGEQGAPDRDGDEALRRDYCEVESCSVQPSKVGRCVLTRCADGERGTFQIMPKSS